MTSAPKSESRDTLIAAPDLNLNENQVIVIGSIASSFAGAATPENQKWGLKAVPMVNRVIKSGPFNRKSL